MKKGDIILTPFPFSDLKGNKTRPAVVLCSNDFDVTICFITSELSWKTENDILLKPNSTNGLKVNSLIRVNKIATVDIDIVLGILGKLSNINIELLNSSLIQILDL